MQTIQSDETVCDASRFAGRIAWAIFCCMALLFAMHGISYGQQPRTKTLGNEKEFSNTLVISVWQLKIIEGELPKWTKDKDPYYPHQYAYRLPMHPYVVMDKDEFAIVAMDGLQSDAFALGVALKKPPTEPVRGTIIVPDATYQKMVKLRFEIPAADFGESAIRSVSDKLDAFYQFLLRYYQGIEIRLSLASTPGASWYRMQAHARKNDATKRSVDADPTSFAYNFLDKDGTSNEWLDYDILREKQAADQSRIAMDRLPQPPVRHIDCQTDSDATGSLDALSSAIPGDQWSLFLPNVQETISAFRRFRVECSRFNWTVNRGGVRRGNVHAADLPTFYETQLALDSSTLLRELPPTLAKSIALTGSDLSFSMGTDIALVIESANIDKLNSLLLAHREKMAPADGQCRHSEGQLEGTRFHLIQNQDRTISSYQAVVGSRLVITNSLEQLKRLAELAKSKKGSMQDDQLYLWLRQRYPLESKDESGLLVVTEPFVHRLATARWRVAEARRWIAAAFRKELQARYVAKDILGGPFELREEAAKLRTPPDSFVLVGDQVQHKVFGSNAFCTPVIEIPVPDVSKGEAKAYQDWMAGYLQRASHLDPVGVRFKNSSQQFEADISLFARKPEVYYFNIDISLNRKIPLRMLTEVMFSEADEPKLLAWTNLVILNDLRRQFPERDPVETFKQLNGRRVASVPGGQYRWNEQWQSMECTVLGCPGSSPPKSERIEVWGNIQNVRLDNFNEPNCSRIEVSVDFEKPLETK